MLGIAFQYILNNEIIVIIFTGIIGIIYAFTTGKRKGKKQEREKLTKKAEQQAKERKKLREEIDNNVNDMFAVDELRKNWSRK